MKSIVFWIKAFQKDFFDFEDDITDEDDDQVLTGRCSLRELRLCGETTASSYETW